MQCSKENAKFQNSAISYVRGLKKDSCVKFLSVIIIINTNSLGVRRLKIFCQLLIYISLF